jgi:hypothetical protein
MRKVSGTDGLRRLNASERLRVRVRADRAGFGDGDMVHLVATVNSTTVRPIAALSVTLERVCMRRTHLYSPIRSYRYRLLYD